MNALVFGDLNDPDSEVASTVAAQHAMVFRAELGTSPSVFFVGGDPNIFELHE